MTGYSDTLLKVTLLANPKGVTASGEPCIQISLLLCSVNIIDYVATLSFYIDLLLQKVASHIDNADALEFFSIIRILR